MSASDDPVARCAREALALRSSNAEIPFSCVASLHSCARIWATVCAVGLSVHHSLNVETDPETLLAYIIQKDGSQARTATDMKMESISSREMVLSYALTGEKRRCVVPFDPVLAGFEEVRPRLLSSPSSLLSLESRADPSRSERRR